MLEHDSGELGSETLGADNARWESAIDRMLGEVLSLMLDGHLHLHLIHNVLLTPVPNPNEAQLQRYFLIHQHPTSIGAFIHDIYFGDDPNSPLALWI